MLGHDAKRFLHFAKASEVDEIPDVPGIYAWYTPLRGDDSGTLRDYLNSLEASFDRYAPLKRLRLEGKQKTFQVDATKPSFSQNYVDELSGTLASTDVQVLSKLVLILSFLSEPFYIGKTDSSLRGRIKSHLGSPDSFDDDNLRNVLKNRVFAQTDSRVLQQCLIAYVPLEADASAHSLPRLLEHVLLRIIQPTQSVKG